MHALVPVQFPNTINTQDFLFISNTTRVYDRPRFPINRIYAYACTCTYSNLRFYSSLYLIIFLCSSIRLTQLILLQRRFFRAEIYRGRLFCPRADRSLGAKQEGLAIVHFLSKLIVSCKEAVRFLF